MKLEYRICWSASSNVTFHGHSEWEEWDDDEATEDDIYTALENGGISDGLEMALIYSGFEWSIEVRTVTDE